MSEKSWPALIGSGNPEAHGYAAGLEAEREAINGLEYFWTVPEGERLIGMVNYRDMIVVATDRSVYFIKESGHGLMEHEIQRINFEATKAMVKL